MRALPAQWVLFVFFGLIFGPGVLFNALFHLGATIRYRQYCPGAITGMVLYLPLAIVLLALSIREAAIGPQAVVWALTVAAVFHTLEVGYSVFKRW